MTFGFGAAFGSCCLSFCRNFIDMVSGDGTATYRVLSCIAWLANGTAAYAIWQVLP